MGSRQWGVHEGVADTSGVHGYEGGQAVVPMMALAPPCHARSDPCSGHCLLQRPSGRTWWIRHHANADLCGLSTQVDARCRAVSAADACVAVKDLKDPS